MNTPLSEKHFILVFILLFTFCAAFLFWQNERELDPDRDKSWWTLSFADPKNPTSLAFTVENHTQESEFTYYITHHALEDIETSYQEAFTVAPGETKTIIPTITTTDNEKTIITVGTGTETKQIYR